MPFRFHVLGLPFTQTNKTWCACAYTQKVLNFCAMMTRRGHKVFHYGAEGADIEGEHINVMKAQEQIDLCGQTDIQKLSNMNWDVNSKLWKRFNALCLAELAHRIEKEDFVCHIAGQASKPIADFITYQNCFHVEYGIGYTGTFSECRAFESYAQMMGDLTRTQKDPDGRNYDAVIPNYYDLADFPIGPGGDYLLFVGRIILRKGLHDAVEIAKRTGKKLIVCGQGAQMVNGALVAEDGQIYRGCDLEYRGLVNPEQRAKLMGGALAILVPTRYIEPFGGVNVESQLCFPAGVKVAHSPVERVHHRRHTGEMIVLETERGDIECTPEHPFLTSKGWTPASGLASGDKLIYNKDYENRKVYERRIEEVVIGLRTSWGDRTSSPDGSEFAINSAQSNETRYSKDMVRKIEIAPRFPLQVGTSLFSGLYRRRWINSLEMAGRQEKTEQSQAVSSSMQHVKRSNGVVFRENTNSWHPHLREENRFRVLPGDKEEYVHIRDFGDDLFQSLPEFVASFGHQKAPNGNLGRMVPYQDEEDSVRTDDGSANPIGNDDGIYEFATIKNIRRRSVVDLPVFNLGTQTGTYEANGFVVHNCGTPAITSDWGGFVDTVEHGRSGYRYRVLDQAVWAVNNAHKLDRDYIARRARGKYSLEKVGEMFEEWFTIINDRWRDGWNTVRPDRTQLDWLADTSERGICAVDAASGPPCGIGNPDPRYLPNVPFAGGGDHREQDTAIAVPAKVG